MRRETHLFDYGTLRRDGAAARLLEACRRVDVGTVRGTLFQVDGGSTALVLDGMGAVQGEILRCPLDLVHLLDEHVGVPERRFRRVGLRVGEFACWTYVAGPALAAQMTPAARLPAGRLPTLAG